MGTISPAQGVLMSISRSNFLSVGKCDGGTEGHPSWAPNRLGRIGPVVGARHGVPPKTLLSASGGEKVDRDGRSHQPSRAG